MRPHLAPDIWPVTTRWETHGDLLVGGVRMSALAATYGCRYGMRLGSSTALAAINAVLASPHLVLAGLDCSIGHQLSRFQAFEGCLREAIAFCAVVRSRTGVSVPALNLGGGHAVAYTHGDDGFALTAFAFHRPVQFAHAGRREQHHRVDVGRDPPRF